MRGERDEIQLLLESRFGQHINVDQHGGANQGWNQAAKKDRLSVKKGVKKDGDADPHSNVDDAADFQAFACFEARDALLFAS
jgi:hypothetical protein